MYSIEKTKSISFFRRFDYLLFATVLLLSILGIIVLGSAVYTKDNGSRMMMTQSISLGLGIALALVISAIDYKDFKVMGMILYLISVALLVYVQFRGTGMDRWGSKSWIRIPGFSQFQPSEIAKIAFISCVAMFLERIKEGQDTKKNLIKLCVYAVIPIGLVIIQPDFGTAAVFIFVFIVMLFVFGMKLKYFAIGFGGIAALAPIVWFSGMLNDKRKARIIDFIFPGSSPNDASYQIDKAEMAIGSGQIFGSGLYRGIQTQNGGVPVNENDFIFTVIGEELGFVGAVSVMLLIFIILLRSMYIARNSRDYFGSYMVAGIASMLGFHFMQNIGMCVRLMPITGIPLPFVSQGGSAMITNYIAIGIVLSVSMRRKRAIFNST